MTNSQLQLIKWHGSASSSTLCLPKVPQHKLGTWQMCCVSCSGNRWSIDDGKPDWYKIQFQLVAVPLPDVVTRVPRERPGHPHQFQTPYCRSNSYRDSLFPLALIQYHHLSPVRPAYLFSRLTFRPSLNPPFLSCFNPLLTSTILLLSICLQVFLYSSKHPTPLRNGHRWLNQSSSQIQNTHLQQCVPNEVGLQQRVRTAPIPSSKLWKTTVCS